MSEPQSLVVALITGTGVGVGIGVGDTGVWLVPGNGVGVDVTGVMLEPEAIVGVGVPTGYPAPPDPGIYIPGTGVGDEPDSEGIPFGDWEGMASGSVDDSPELPALENIQPATMIDTAINAQNTVNFDIFAFIVCTTQAFIVNICCWLSAFFYIVSAEKSVLSEILMQALLPHVHECQVKKLQR